MKKSKLLALFAFMVFGSSVMAQENVVKIRPATLFIKNINLSYERAMPNGKHSLGIHTGFLLPRSIPNLIVENDAVGDTEFENKIGGFSLTPEYRFYTSGTALEGFYVAPYAKFGRYSISLNAEYDGYEAEAKGSYTSFGLGAAIGYQWVLGSGFTIDWTFIGLGANRNSVGVKFIGDDPDINYSDWEDDIKKEFGDVPLIGDKMNVETGEDYIKLSAPFTGLGFRSMFTLGYAF